MSYQPHLHRENELYHSRPFGSRNGISNTPGYKAVGKLARFVVRGGKRIYESAGRLWDGSAGAGTGMDAAARATGLANRHTKASQVHERLGNTREAVAARRNAAVEKANARKAQKAYENSIVGRANAARTTIGNWLNERGKQASDAAGRAGRFISSIAGRARTAIGNAWDGSAGKGTGLDRAAEATNKANRHSKAANIYGNMGDVSNSVRARRDAAVEKANARKAQQAYDRSIVGRFNAARDWLGNRAKDVSDAAGRAGTAVSNARTAIGNAWDGKAGKGPGKTQMQEYGKSGRGREAQEYKEAYDRSVVGTGERMLNRAGQAIRGGAAAVSSGVKRAGKAASDAYTRSGASNTARTLTTKGAIQVGKNVANAFGGREAQQAKGNKLNVQNANRSAQERKQYVQQVDRDWGNAQRYLDRLQDKANNAKTEKELQKQLANIDRFMNETYRPAQAAYNNVHKNKKK